MAEPKPRRSQTSKGMWAGFVLLAILFIAWMIFRHNPFAFHRSRFEAVVARVRTFQIPPGETWEFRLDSLTDPGSLRRRSPSALSERGRGAGDVWASRTAVGKLKVVIETLDLGHAGERGFAYSEEPLTPKPFGFSGGWYSIDVPGHLNLVKPEMKIDESWWKVIYNLD